MSENQYVNSPALKSNVQQKKQIFENRTVSPNQDQETRKNSNHRTRKPQKLVKNDAETTVSYVQPMSPELITSSDHIYDTIHHKVSGSNISIKVNTCRCASNSSTIYVNR